MFIGTGYGFEYIKEQLVHLKTVVLIPAFFHGFFPCDLFSLFPRIL